VLIAWLKYSSLNRSFTFLQTFDVKDLASFSAAVWITLWSCNHLDVAITRSYSPFESEAFNTTKNIALIIERCNFNMRSVINVEVAEGRKYRDVVDQTQF